jgi:hypothetical protein
VLIHDAILTTEAPTIPTTIPLVCSMVGVIPVTTTLNNKITKDLQLSIAMIGPPYPMQNAFVNIIFAVTCRNPQVIPNIISHIVNTGTMINHIV